MARTSNVFARVEPAVKEQAEIVLDELGIPMSNAIGIFLRQVALRRGLPFDVKLPEPAPLAYGTLTKRQFDDEIEKGFADYRAGKSEEVSAVFDDLERERHGIQDVGQPVNFFLYQRSIRRSAARFTNQKAKSIHVVKRAR
jgi:addiction module RelB/DinJ family antitoxin